MKCVVFIAVYCLVVASSLPRRKRTAYELPDGAELIVGPIETTFVCDESHSGYYADISNNCQIFHICDPKEIDGARKMLQYSFYCGNQTFFDQLTLTCTYLETAVHCGNAITFQNVNDNIGNPDALFLTEEKVQSANALKSNTK
ncbi:U-scoloptoxin(01)-Cw1a-like [Tachypleus tridentatus]|uniref:U-scoloptoxin(01)-Cw1a-like n=1 Tax=Tachypleus tridentatus TaxID=6853 RepID=UPI003FD0A121